jgi:hypothetical protein
VEKKSKSEKIGFIERLFIFPACVWGKNNCRVNLPAFYRSALHKSYKKKIPSSVHYRYFSFFFREKHSVILSTRASLFFYFSMSGYKMVNPSNNISDSFDVAAAPAVRRCGRHAAAGTAAGSLGNHSCLNLSNNISDSLDDAAAPACGCCG